MIVIVFTHVLGGLICLFIGRPKRRLATQQ